MIKTIEIDIYRGILIYEILDLIEKHKGRIINHLSNGPGGGNPCLHITFTKYEHAKSFIKEFDPENVHAYLK